jgi:CBS domain-containing protein
MNVRAILRQKGRAVTTASPAATLLEVANKLAAKRIGAVVIIGEKGTVGALYRSGTLSGACRHKGLSA